MHAEGLLVQSFETLIDHRSSIGLNKARLRRRPSTTLAIVTQPTRIPVRAFELW